MSLSLSSDYIYGIIAAVVSPLFTTIGFLLWECYLSSTASLWSAFALNLYKCGFATLLFLCTIAIRSIIFTADGNGIPNDDTYTFWSFQQQPIENELNSDHTTTKQEILGYLFISSVIGIVIGDLLWLQSLQLLGTVRVVFMDALKPFCATIFGIVILKEPFRTTILIGILFTVIGILCMSLDNQESQQQQQQQQPSQSLSNTKQNDEHGSIDTTADNHHHTDPNIDIDTSDDAADDRSPIEEATQQQRRRSRKLWIGYSMSIANVVLDTYGSILTKQYGSTISIWHINCLRFGFAGGILLLISISMTLYNHIFHNSRSTTSNNGVNDKEPYGSRTSDTIDVKKVDQRNISANAIPSVSQVTLADIATTTTTSTTTNTTEKKNTDVVDSATATISTTTTCNVTTTIAAMYDNSSADKTRIVPWYLLPMTCCGNGDAAINTSTNNNTNTSVWVYMSLGVVFVTYIAPTLYNYALFEISFALTLTLSSIGPFYAIPLSYLLKRYLFYNHNKYQQECDEEVEDTDELRSLPPQRPSVQSWIGAIFTVTGIVVLVYSGG